MREILSLEEMINKQNVPSRALALIQRDLVDIMIIRQGEESEHPQICIENITFDSDLTSISIEDNHYSDDYNGDIYSYGVLIEKVLKAIPIKQQKLSSISQKCINGEFKNAHSIQLALEKRISNTIYIPLIIIIALLMGVLAWLSNT